MKQLGLLLWNLPEIIGSLLLAAITAIVGGAVVSRYVFFFAFTWAEELVRFLFIWLAFIGGALAAKHATHFRLTLIRNYMPPTLQRALDVFGDVCFIVLGGILLIYGYELSSRTMGQTSQALHLAQGLVYLSVPIGGAMMIFFSCINAYRDVRGHQEDQGEPAEI